MKDIHNIWPTQTGIEDLPKNWQDFRASEVESIQKIWSEQRDRLKGSKQLSDFSDKLAREWAIETGVIEGLKAYPLASGCPTFSGLTLAPWRG